MLNISFPSFQIAGIASGLYFHVFSFNVIAIHTYKTSNIEQKGHTNVCILGIQNKSVITTVPHTQHKQHGQEY